MRLALALATAAAATGTLTGSAQASCLPIWDRVVSVESCSAPGGPASTRVCHIATNVCVGT